MGVGIEFFPSNEKNQGIQIGCPDLLCRVFTEKMQTCSHCSTIVFKINLEDIDPLLCHQRLFHLVVRRQFWILNVHCQI